MSTNDMLTAERKLFVLIHEFLLTIAWIYTMFCHNCTR